MAQDSKGYMTSGFHMTSTIAKQENKAERDLCATPAG